MMRGGGKFAAMAAKKEEEERGAGPQDGLLTTAATMAASDDGTSSSTHPGSNNKEERRKVWNQLNEAEDLCVRLLEIAEETSQALSHTATIAKIDTKTFPATLSQIHALLSPHNVHAYRQPTVYRMYQARVERQMAQDRRDILQEWMKQQEKQVTVDEPAVGEEAKAPAPKKATSKRSGSKRKR